MLKGPFEKTYHGKLLLMGEYFVLDGVPALAVPTKLGQRFSVRNSTGEGLHWLARDVRGKEWFKTSLNWDGSLGYHRYPNAFSKRLYEILRAADAMRPGLLQEATHDKSVTSHLEFDRLWGLGTSSTLIAFLADWFQVNPYELLERTFGGSGYDLACATADGPIVYTRGGNHPTVETTDWNPEWLQQTYFVYRNQKQDSREGIKAYRAATVSDKDRQLIAGFTRALTVPGLQFRAAQDILLAHEETISNVLGLSTVQAEHFSDFPGQIKSLGAWGGDFIWALADESSEDVTTYFNDLGYQTVIPYNDLID